MNVPEGYIIVRVETLRVILDYLKDRNYGSAEGRLEEVLFLVGD